MKLPQIHITSLRKDYIQKITTVGHHRSRFHPTLPTIMEIHELLHSVLVEAKVIRLDLRDPDNTTSLSVLYTLIHNLDGHFNSIYFNIKAFSVVDRADTVFDMPLSCIGDSKAFEEYLQTLSSRVSNDEYFSHGESCIRIRNFILDMPLIIVLN